MKTGSRFLELEERPGVPVDFQGTPMNLPDGANLAAALLAAGVTVLRHTPVSGAARGPFCMMGACFDCLVRIDGVVRQACMVQVVPGLRVEAAHDTGVPNDGV